MMFGFHSALFLGYVALVSGVALYVWALRNEGAGSRIAKFFGALVVFFTLLGFICTSYYGIKYWKAGDFESVMPMHKMMMPMGEQGMQPGMMQCPCMQHKKDQMNQKDHNMEQN